MDEKPIDAITLEVIQHRLVSIADDMEVALLRSSFSTIVKEGRDATTALFDSHGRTVAQALGVPFHLGTLACSVPAILEYFPVANMREGDVFVSNDPYKGGTHLPDITMVIPIFREGKVVALGANMVHHQDIGAMTAGIPATATSIFQEGLNIPPLKLYDAGQLNQTLEAIIRNNVRIPETVMGDIRAQVAAGNVGKLRFRELVKEYGEYVVLAAMEQLLDYAEELTRQEILKIPDGTYSFADYMDNDGVELDKRIKIQVKLTIKGSGMTVDFSGSSPEVKGPFNCPVSGAYTCAGYVLRALGGSLPVNAGCFRPITVLEPAMGTILNPHSTLPVGARASTAERIVDTMLGALVKAVPERVIAASGGEPLLVYFGGTDPATGQHFVGHESAKSGLGARPTKDGVDVICTDISNAFNVPVEAFETSFPFRVLCFGLHENSGGAGKYRGGLGAAKVFELLRGEGVSVTFRGERHYTTAWGLFGGLPGANGRAYVLRKNGKVEEIPSKRDFFLNKGDQLHLYTPGGGGYGDPLDRDPNLVLQDVVDKKVSIEAAANDYGVMIDRESLTIELNGTVATRRKLREARGPVTWTYNRGLDGKE